MGHKSGMSKLQIPDILAYPEVLKFTDITELHDKFVYVIKAYPLDGLAVMVYRADEQVYFKFADFDGKIIDPTGKHKLCPLIQKFLSERVGKFVALMKSAHIPQAMYYFSVVKDNLVLVDMRTSLNKFAGPGMLRDLFAKFTETQEVLKTVKLTPEAVEAIKSGTGNFSGDIILKTSAFKTVTRPGKDKQKLLPMYGIMQR